MDLNEISKEIIVSHQNHQEVDQNIYTIGHGTW